MNQKEKYSHAAKAATKAALYEGKAAEDKADIKDALESYQLACDLTKNPVRLLRLGWTDALNSSMMIPQ